MKVLALKLHVAALAVTLSCATVSAFAQSAGYWTFAVGAHQVNPKSGNGSLAGGTLPVNVDSDAKPTLALEYFFHDRVGLEVLAAWPFEHDINIDGLGRVGSTKHLPPTITVHYYFGEGTVRPFLGAGINYTLFFSESTAGALAGSELSLENSWGASVHGGLDFAVGDHGAIRVDVRWFDIDTDVRLDGVDLGTVNIDPLAYGVAYVFKF